MSEPLGIIGLGRIGLPAAKAWLNLGYKVFGCDLDPHALNEFSTAGGTALATPADVARQAHAIMVLVLNDDQVTQVINGKNGILEGSHPRTTVVCMSTINRRTLESVADSCHEKNIPLVDCPFTGGPARIPTRTLTLIAAAPQDTLNRVNKILEGIGKINYAGVIPGEGQSIKHCNQLLVGITHAATMEVIALARKLDLDPALVASVAGNGIAGSDYFRLLSESVLKGTSSPGRLGQMCKDMNIVKNTLEENEMRASVAEAACAYFSIAQRQGMEQREGADLIHVVERWKGEIGK
jgi:3-hydroxyisobutyrate dehydrogenase-like beta-hydroxyacid dehydrogenase